MDDQQNAEHQELKPNITELNQETLEQATGDGSNEDNKYTVVCVKCRNIQMRFPSFISAYYASLMRDKHGCLFCKSKAGFIIDRYHGE